MRSSNWRSQTTAHVYFFSSEMLPHLVCVSQIFAEAKHGANYRRNGLYHLLQWNLKALQKLQLLTTVEWPSGCHGWKKIGCILICSEVATCATVDSAWYPKMPVCLYSQSVQLFQLAPLHCFPPAAIVLGADTGSQERYNCDGVKAEQPRGAFCCWR